jgi:hypothetical protein
MGLGPASRPAANKTGLTDAIEEPSSLPLACYNFLTAHAQAACPLPLNPPPSRA